MSKNVLNMTEPLAIEENVYWLGVEDPVSGFHYNHYLLIDGDQVILFNPGGSSSVISTLEKFSSKAPPHRITHTVVTGHTPELTRTVAEIEKQVREAGGALTIVTHPRASHRISYYYGLNRSSFHHVDQDGWRLRMNSGRTLRFLSANNIGHTGSFMTFDEKSGILFSGELFSGYSFGWSLYANDYYLPAMEAYHYDHLPFVNLLQGTLDGLAGLGVRLIAPNHGSLINKNIPMYVDALRNVRKTPAVFHASEVLGGDGEDQLAGLA